MAVTPTSSSRTVHPATLQKPFRNSLRKKKNVSIRLEIQSFVLLRFVLKILFCIYFYSIIFFERYSTPTTINTKYIIIKYILYIYNYNTRDRLHF